MGNKSLPILPLLLFFLGVVAGNVSETREPKWALDSTGDYVNTEFRFYNYNTQKCLHPDGYGAVWNTGSCDGITDIFHFHIHGIEGVDGTGNYYTYNIIKFYQKSTGLCLSVDEHNQLIMEGCQLGNRNQEWYKANSWQGARLYIQLQNEGMGKCIADSEDGGWGLRLLVENCEYKKNGQWWQLMAVK